MPRVYGWCVSGAAIFILLWALIAICVGTFAALRPAAVERLATRMGSRFGYSERTRRLQVHLNRIGGIFFVVAGGVFAVLVVTGVMPPR